MFISIKYPCSLGHRQTWISKLGQDWMPTSLKQNLNLIHKYVPVMVICPVPYVNLNLTRDSACNMLGHRPPTLLWNLNFLGQDLLLVRVFLYIVYSSVYLKNQKKNKKKARCLVSFFNITFFHLEPFHSLFCVWECEKCNDIN